MTTKKPISHAFSCLTHPVTLSTIALMVLNDFVFHPLSPSWLTGKLSDVAWLILAPLVAAAMLALVLPRRAGRAVGPLAFLLCAGCFTLLKISPESNRWLLEPARRLSGIGWYTASDPTDLLALPAIGIAWYLWIQSKGKMSRQVRRRWLILIPATLTLLADAPAPFRGISCLSQDEDKITAFSEFGNELYTSADGGMSWQAGLPGSTESRVCLQHETSWEIADPGDDQIRYRLVYGEGIDRSADGGKTWQREVALNEDEARYYYYRKFYSYAAGAGPYDALFDTRTGNLVVAMGFDGVLVRDSGGQWIPVAVDEYHHEELSTDMVLSLLSGEIWLAAIAIILIAGLLNRASLGYRRRDVVFAVLGWLIWGFAVLLAPAGIAGSADYVTGPMLGVATLLAAVTGIISLIVGKVWTQRVSSLLRMLLISLCGALLFLAPYLLWAQGVIGSYLAAQIAGPLTMILLAAGSLVVMLRSRKTPQLPDTPA